MYSVHSRNLWGNVKETTITSNSSSEFHRYTSCYLSQYLTNMMHKICFTVSFISCIYMFRAHVVIIRRSASGIITPIECDDTRGCVMQFWPPDDDHMCSKHVEAWNKTYCDTYRCVDTRGCVMQFWPPDDKHMCSKHVEAWNKTYCEKNFVHQVG